MARVIDLPVPYGWYAIAYSNEMAVGEIKTVHYFEREMILIRGESGALSLMAAYCPHLGAHIGKGGKVVGDTVQCPFHSWRFDGEGNCVEVPYAEKVPPRARDQKCLQTYTVQEVNGIIWAWYHPQNVEALWELHSFEEIESGEWTDYQTHEWIIKTHVQESGENAVDTAHFASVHQCGDLLSKPEITFEGPKRVSIINLALTQIDKDANIVEGEYLEGGVYTACIGPGQTWTRQYGDMVGELLIVGLPTPIDSQTLHLRVACSVPSNQTKDHKFISDAIIMNTFNQIDQDVPIWENKIYQPDPILCDGDGPIAQYRKWFQQFYNFNQ